MSSRSLRKSKGEDGDGRHDGVDLDTLDGTYIRAYGALWNSITKDAEETIAIDDLEKALKRTDLDHTKEELNNLIYEMDTDGNGVIDREEFMLIMARLSGQTLTETKRGRGCIRGADSDKLSAKQFVWVTMDDPTFSYLSLTISTVILLTIVVAVVNICIETLPSEQDNPVYARIEVVMIIVFTVEYLLRILSCPNMKNFMLSIMNTIDLVSIAPFYVELFVDNVEGTTSIFRVLRLIRVVRVFKVSRYVSWIKLLSAAVRRSLAPLSMAMFVSAIGAVMISSVMYFLERGEYDEENRIYVRPDTGNKSQIQSIPDALWWCIITITTVGYGDVTPVTAEGKIVGALTSLAGILLLALPISVFSKNFSDLYVTVQRRKALTREDTMRTAGNKKLLLRRTLVQLDDKDTIAETLAQRYDLTTPEGLAEAVEDVIVIHRMKLWTKQKEVETEYKDRLYRAVSAKWPLWFDVTQDSVFNIAREFATDQDKLAQAVSPFRRSIVPTSVRHRSKSYRSLKTQWALDASGSMLLSTPTRGPPGEGGSATDSTPRRPASSRTISNLAQSFLPTPTADEKPMPTVERQLRTIPSAMSSPHSGTLGSRKFSDLESGSMRKQLSHRHRSDLSDGSSRVAPLMAVCSSDGPEALPESPEAPGPPPESPEAPGPPPESPEAPEPPPGSPEALGPSANTSVSEVPSPVSEPTFEPQSEPLSDDSDHGEELTAVAPMDSSVREDGHDDIVQLLDRANSHSSYSLSPALGPLGSPLGRSQRGQLLEPLHLPGHGVRNGPSDPSS